MGFLKSIGKGLFGSGPSIKKRQLFSEEDFGRWMETVMSSGEGYLGNLLKDFFGSTAALQGGTFGGQQGRFAAQGVASQLPSYMNTAANLTSGQNEMVVKPGSTGILPALATGAGIGMGSSIVPFLGKLFGGGGIQTGITSSASGMANKGLIPGQSGLPRYF